MKVGYKRGLIFSVVFAICIFMLSSVAFASSEVSVSSWAEFTDALNSGASVIKLTQNISTPRENGNAGDNVLIIDKSVAINGGGHGIQVNGGGIILGADVTLENIKINLINSPRNAIFANGYKLVLKDVSKDASAPYSIHLFCGGIDEYNGTNKLPATGNHGQIVIDGNSNILGNIYAGSLADNSQLKTPNTFLGSATITLPDGGGQIGNVYASGAYEPRDGSAPNEFYAVPKDYKVDGTVTIKLNGRFSGTINGNTGGSENAVVEYSYPRVISKGATLTDVKEFTVRSGELSLRRGSDLSGTDINIANGAQLSLTSLGKDVTINSIAGNGTVIIEENQTITINKNASGTTNVALGGINSRGGSFSPPRKGHRYISVKGSKLTGNEFVFLKSSSTEKYTPIYDRASNSWVSKSVKTQLSPVQTTGSTNQDIVISDISIQATHKVTENNTANGVDIPIAVTYDNQPDQNKRLAFVELEVKVNDKQATRENITDSGYKYTADDINIDIVAPKDAVNNRENLHIESKNGTLPKNEYKIAVEIPSKNMKDSKEKTINTTLTVEEKPQALTSIAVPSANANLVYNGTEQIGVNEGIGYTVTGHKQTNAGSYTATITPASGYQWNDNTTHSKSISWSIAKAVGSGSVTLSDWAVGESSKVPVPTSTTNGVSGVTYMYKVAGADDSTYTATVPTTKGNYVIKATFPETENYKEVVATANFTINQFIEYTISTGVSPTVGGYVNGGGRVRENTTVTLTALPSTGYSFLYWTEDGREIRGAGASYTFVATKDRNLVAIFKKVPEKLPIADEPYSNGGLVYNGAEQIGVDYGEGYSITGNVGTDAGSYRAVLTLVPGYEWRDGTRGIKTVDWTIEKAKGDGSVIVYYNTEDGITEVPMPIATSGTNDVNTVVYDYKKAGASDKTYQSFSTPPTKPGNYILRATFEENKNYKRAVATTSFTIKATPPKNIVISADASPKIGGSVSGADRFIKDSTVTLTAQPSENYIFSHWLENGKRIEGEGQAYTFTAEKSRKLVAVFERIAEETIQDRIVKNELERVPRDVTKYKTVDEVKNAMLDTASMYGAYSAENTAFYDVKLRLPDSEKYAKEEDFPKEGITVEVMYKDIADGVGMDTHDFVVTHMFGTTSRRLNTKAGEIETPKVTELPDRISFTLNGLSPVSISWKDTPRTDVNIDNSNSAIDKPIDGGTVNDSMAPTADGNINIMLYVGIVICSIVVVTAIVLLFRRFYN